MNPLTEFEALSKHFEEQFSQEHFPAQPAGLYDAAQYILSLRGKRIRPVLCLMANELFAPISEDAFHAANAIELFHNFTLIHDDIMDRASVRRGQPSVHARFGESTAILAGDVMLVQAYEYLKKVGISYLPKSLSLFNDTAKKVCEGQQLDMESEKNDAVSMEQYLEMVELKTSVLLAASLRMGALLGGAGLANQENLYEFGKNMGIAFQIQDDYLDAFGDPAKFGKKRGGDIMANKKTFLLIHALHHLPADKKEELDKLLAVHDESKIDAVIQLYQASGADDQAREMKQKYFDQALQHLEEVAVVSKRKEPLRHLAHYLLNRES